MRWRIIVLLIMIGMIALLFWQGYDLIAALGITVVILVVAARVIPLIVDTPPSSPVAPPAAEPPPVTTEDPATGLFDVLVQQALPAPARLVSPRTDEPGQS